MIWVINWEYKWVLRLFWLFKSYKILHIECDISPMDSAKSCGRASNMATGLYAMSYTITHGSSVLHSKGQTVDAESETFNSLFKSSKSVDGYRIVHVDVCVAACPNGPWASIDAALKGCKVLNSINSSTSVFVSKLPIYSVKMYQKELYCLSILLSFPPELLSMFS